MYCYGIKRWILKFSSDLSFTFVEDLCLMINNKKKQAKYASCSKKENVFTAVFIPICPGSLQQNIVPSEQVQQMYGFVLNRLFL